MKNFRTNLHEAVPDEIGVGTSYDPGFREATWDYIESGEEQQVRPSEVHWTTLRHLQIDVAPNPGDVKREQRVSPERLRRRLEVAWRLEMWAQGGAHKELWAYSDDDDADMSRLVTCEAESVRLLLEPVLEQAQRLWQRKSSAGERRQLRRGASDAGGWCLDNLHGALEGHGRTHVVARSPRQQRTSPGRRRGPRRTVRSSAKSGDSPPGSEDPGGDPPPRAAGEKAKPATGPGAPCHWCGEAIPDFKPGAKRRTPSHAKGCCQAHCEYVAKGRQSAPEQLAHRFEREPRMRVYRARLVDAFEAEVDPNVLEVFELESAGRVWRGHRRHVPMAAAA
jgi:hypothetical protein